MNAVEIKKGKIGQSVLGGEDSISGYLFSYFNSSAPSGMSPNKAYEVYTLNDLKLLGITPAYDSTNEVAVYRDLKEFYRLAGEGTKLYLMGCSDNLQTILAGNALEILLNASKGSIRQLGLAGYKKSQTGAFINGLDSGVYYSIPLAQDKANTAFDAGRPLQIVLSAVKISNYASLEHFRDDDSDIYENVSLCIGNNYPSDGISYEAPLVGTLLGTIALATVNENIGKVESYRIDDPLKAINTTPAFGTTPTHQIADADLKVLTQKGYIYPLEYTDYTGVYWNDDPTLTKEVMDEEGNLNPSSIQKGRTINKAVRLVRKFLTGQLKKNYKLHPTTGRLPSSTIKLLEKECEQALDSMGHEISGRKVTINPNSNLLTGERALEVEQIKVVSEGVIGIVKGNINLTRSA